MKNIIYLFKSNNILNDLNFLRQDLKLPINKILKIILIKCGKKIKIML